MNQQTDVLTQLHQLVQGRLYIDINDHRSGYHSVAEEIKQYPLSVYASADQSDLDEAIAKNTMVTISCVPVYPGEKLEFFGAEVVETVTRALEKVKEHTGNNDFKMAPLNEFNSINLLKELVDLCDASVTLSINEFKTTQYWDVDTQDYTDGVITAERYLADEQSFDDRKFVADEEGDYEIHPELVKQMIEKDLVISTQFYPNTPISFFHIYSTNLGELLNTSVGCVKADKPPKLTSDTIEAIKTLNGGVLPDALKDS